MRSAMASRIARPNPGGRGWHLPFRPATAPSKPGSIDEHGPHSACPACLDRWPEAGRDPGHHRGRCPDHAGGEPSGPGRPALCPGRRAQPVHERLPQRHRYPPPPNPCHAGHRAGFDRPAAGHGRGLFDGRGWPLPAPLVAATATARQRFAARLAERPLLADGGMGTLLYSRGVPQRACLEELVVRRPDLVGAAHREYLAAGAELIETLTFGANRLRLASAGLDITAGLLNRRAAALAREARDVAGREALVGGSIGPLESAGRGTGRQPDAVRRDAFREQLDGLLEGGIDVVVLETFVDLDELLIAIEVARQASDLPIIASLTFGEDLILPNGTTPEQAAIAVAAAGADVIGVNCGAGPQGCIDALEQMSSVFDGGATGSVMPNAGLSQRLADRFVYAAAPEYLAAMTARMLAA